MQKPVGAETEERLIRLRTNRRGRVVDLRVHYEISFRDGCRVYRILTIDEVD